MAAVELVDQDFAGEDEQPDEAVVFYELRNGKMQAAFPVFVDGTQGQATAATSQRGQPPQRIGQADRRVASIMPKAIVNRLWAHFLGYGFTKPIDDMGPHNAPSHPELLERLASRIPHAQLRSEGADPLDRAERAVRAVEQVQPEQQERRSRARRKADVQPFLSAADACRRAVRIAARGHRGPQGRGSYEEQEGPSATGSSSSPIAFGTDENDETTTFNGTIPQTLMMMNGDLINKAISTDKGGFLDRSRGDDPN